VAQRVLAVLGAIGLVLAAIAVRNVIDDEDPSDRNFPGAIDDDVNVVCAVAPACEELIGRTVSSARPQSVLSDLEAGNPNDLDVWVTTSSWLEVLEARAPEVIAEVRSLASTPAIVAALPQRAEAIETLCTGQRLWACLGAGSGTSWAELGQPAVPGVLSVGLTDPERDLGLPVLAAAAAGYFGDLDFASNDFDDGFRSALGNLTDLTTGEATVRVMVTASGTYTAVGSLLAPARTESGAREIAELEPVPPISATVVAIRFNGDTAFPDLDPVTDALIDEGWGAVDGAPPAPVLKPGVMAALLTLWTEVNR
jgi:hypothetical protein